MREKLLHSGREGRNLKNLVEDLRNRFGVLQNKLEARYKNDDDGKPSRSVTAMVDTEKFKGTTYAPTPAHKLEAQRNLERAATERARITGESKEKVATKTIEITEKNRGMWIFKQFQKVLFIARVVSAIKSL